MVKVGIKNGFWENVSKELNPMQMRILVLMLSQQKEFKIHQTVIAAKLNTSAVVCSREMKKLKELGYVNPPVHPKDENDGWRLQRKATTWKAEAGAPAGYQLYDVDFICNPQIDNYEWLIESFVRAYRNIDGVLKNTKFLSEKLHMDARTIRKHTSAIEGRIVKEEKEEEKPVFIQHVNPAIVNPYQNGFYF